ncbi:hypothetical protein Tco_0923210 [Tanacetum coccineum]|uniref:Gag-Pol polyprotein n=1 Tax=Tanacetum coccineum TaxID=301880 RepID=A0ABQ5D3M5_9ASTR
MKAVQNSVEFRNVFMRFGFGSAIKLVSFDESQVVTFNSKSFAVSRIVIAEPRVGATTRSAAHLGSSSIGSSRLDLHLASRLYSPLRLEPFKTLVFSTPVQEQGETSSGYVDSSNMHTFYQQHPSEHRWTKDHPLEQVIRNPSQSIRTRRQLEIDGEMCMFALTVSQTEPKNIKEAMADSAWIKAMQEELHQFD